ncbi:MAG: hypothetical protein ACREMB_24540, partial [Candidatus Rokuibacteriota bacterium]
RTRRASGPPAVRSLRWPPLDPPTWLDPYARRRRERSAHPAAPCLSRAAILALALLGALAATAEARTVEVHLVLGVDLQRAQRGGPPDEPLEPAPSLEDLARETVAAHPAFRGVSVTVVASDSAPSPRTPADFLRLVNQGVDDLVVVQLDYHARLDGFHASGRAGVRGFVSVHSVAARRKVLSRPVTVAVAYPGDVTKEAVITAELAARARGTAVPVEEVELALVDAAVKRRLRPELAVALSAYRAEARPGLSKAAVQDATRRLAEFLAASPDRRAEAVQVLEDYVRRYPDAPDRQALERRLQDLRLGARRSPGQEAERDRERAANRVAQSLTARQLAELFASLVGRVVEVRSFKLDWQPDGTVLMTPTDKKQTIIVEQVPPGVQELDADPSPIYILVVGRRELFAEVPAFPVVRWIGCPRTACPAR